MAGLYLHVPFCAHHCAYCDFAVVTGQNAEARRRYVAALRADLEAVAAAGPSALAPPGPSALAPPGPAALAPPGPSALAPPGADTGADWPAFDSVFVGGGTPTLLAVSELAGLLRHARDLLPVAADAEVSVEANPESVDACYLAGLVEAGLTRLSVGAQSFSAAVLAFLDRRHDPEAPLRAVAAARDAGVAQVSVDLIYGAPAETDADWADSLERVVQAGPDHVSCYALTLEPNTRYAASVRAGRQPAPDDDVAADRMAAAGWSLARAGLRRYEISNWARPGAQCRHNLNYWRGGDYLGVGLGAHGHWAGRRWWSLRSLRRYSDAALAGRSTLAGAEVLSAAERRAERLMLGLRLSDGVERAAVDPVDDAAAAALVDAGLLADDPARLRLTAAGRPLADAVTLRLLPV